MAILNRKIRHALVASVTATALVLSGCTNTSPDGQENAATSTSAAQTTAAAASIQQVEPVGIPLKDDPSAPGYLKVEGDQATINDMNGKPFTFRPGAVQRVANLWPASNAAMPALGAEDFFAARVDIGDPNTAWQEHISPKFADVPVLDAKDSPTAEEMLKQDYDLIIQSQAAEDYTNANLPAISLMFSNYQDMKVAFWVLGTILGPEYQQKAVDWAALVDHNIERVDKALQNSDNPNAAKEPLTYYMQAQGKKPTLTSTFRAPSIIQEWTEHAGGKYWVAEVDGGFLKADDPHAPNVNMEAVLDTPPEKIVIGGRNANAVYEELMGNKGPENPWTGILAQIGEDNVEKSPNGLFSWDRFGAEAALEILWAARFIHPEVFADPESPDFIDMVQETRDFFSDFVGYDMSAEEAEAMLNNQNPPA